MSSVDIATLLTNILSWLGLLAIPSLAINLWFFYDKKFSSRRRYKRDLSLKKLESEEAFTIHQNRISNLRHEIEQAQIGGDREQAATLKKSVLEELEQYDLERKKRNIEQGYLMREAGASRSTGMIYNSRWSIYLVRLKKFFKRGSHF